MKFFFLFLIVLIIFSQESFSQSEITLTPDDYEIPVEKNPGEAFLLSFLIPGAGQMHNDEVGKGFAIMGIFVASNVAFAISSNDNSETSAIFAIVAVGSWIYSFIDAPLIARDINEEIRKKNAKLKHYEHQLLLDIKNKSIGHDLDGRSINSVNLCLSIGF